MRAALRQLLLSGSSFLANPEIVTFGDSRTFINRTIGAGSVTGYSDDGRGYMDWAAALADQRRVFSYDGCFGLNGATISDMRANGLTSPTWAPNTPGLYTPLTHPAGTVVFFGGSADFANSVSLATVQSDFMQIMKQLTARGKRVIVISEIPRGKRDDGVVSNALSVANAANLKAYHDWMLGLNIRGVTVVDCWQDFIDPASGTNYYNLQGTLWDGLHPNVWGGYLIGARVAAAINALYPAYDYAALPTSNSDLFDASTNPFGCLNTQPLLPKTANLGSKSSSGGVAMTGNVCSGLSISNSAALGSGVTITCSQDTNADGWDQQNIAWSGTAAAAGNITCGISTNLISNLTKGDLLRGAVLAGFDTSTFQNVANIGLQIQVISGSSPSLGVSFVWNTNGFNFPSTIPAFRKPILTSILDTGAMGGTISILQFNWLIQLAAAGTVAGSVSLSRLALRKVASLH